MIPQNTPAGTRGQVLDDEARLENRLLKINLGSRPWVSILLNSLVSFTD